MNKKDKAKIVSFIFVGIFTFIMLITTILFAIKNKKLEQKAEFSQVKEGLCVYVESHKTAYKTEYTYCLVYDEETESVIEVDLYEELIHGDIRVGDTIVYVVDYDYTDVDFLNVIYQ
jgi:hypothetical protein